MVISRTHSSKCDGMSTHLTHLHLNLNIFCIQVPCPLYRSHVHCTGVQVPCPLCMFIAWRVQEIQVPHIYIPMCTQNHEPWLISQAHSSKYDGDVTILLHILINFVQWSLLCPTVQVSCSEVVGFKRYDCTNLPTVCTKTMKMYLIAGAYSSKPDAAVAPSRARTL